MLLVVLGPRCQRFAQTPDLLSPPPIKFMVSMTFVPCWITQTIPRVSQKLATSTSWSRVGNFVLDKTVMKKYRWQHWSLCILSSLSIIFPRHDCWRRVLTARSKISGETRQLWHCDISQVCKADAPFTFSLVPGVAALRLRPQVPGLWLRSWGLWPGPGSAGITIHPLALSSPLFQIGGSSHSQIWSQSTQVRTLTTISGSLWRWDLCSLYNGVAAQIPLKLFKIISKKFGQGLDSGWLSGD